MQHREACNELHPGSAGAESTPRAHLTGTPTRGFHRPRSNSFCVRGTYWLGGI